MTRALCIALAALLLLGGCGSKRPSDTSRTSSDGPTGQQEYDAPADKSQSAAPAEKSLTDSAPPARTQAQAQAPTQTSDQTSDQTRAVTRPVAAPVARESVQTQPRRDPAPAAEQYAPPPARSQTASAPTQPARAPVPVAPPAPVAPVAPPADAAVHGAVYDCTFQLGAFSTAENAQRLKQQVAAKGIGASVEQTMVNNTQRWRVLIRLVGTEEQIRTALERIGGDKPILRERKLVSGAKSESGPTNAGQLAALPPPPPTAEAAGRGQSPGPAVAATPPRQTVSPAASPAPTPTPATLAYAETCSTTAGRIEAKGQGQSRGANALMAAKAARETAKRNLILCVEAYRERRASLPAESSLAATLQERFVRYTLPVKRPDGSVEIRASVAVKDLAAIRVGAR